jgi:hypothetical protein
MGGKAEMGSETAPPKAELGSETAPSKAELGSETAPSKAELGSETPPPGYLHKSHELPANVHQTPPRQELP